MIFNKFGLSVFLCFRQLRKTDPLVFCLNLTYIQVLFEYDDLMNIMNMLCSVVSRKIKNIVPLKIKNRHTIKRIYFEQSNLCRFDGRIPPKTKISY